MAEPTPDLPQSRLLSPEVGDAFLAQLTAATAALKQAALAAPPDSHLTQHMTDEDIRAGHLGLLELATTAAQNIERALALALQKGMPIPLGFFDTNAEDDPEITAATDDFDRAVQRLNALLGHVHDQLKQGGTQAPAHIAPFTPDAISFINARPMMAAMRAMWAGVEGWQRPADGQPYFTDKSGVMVYAQEGTHFNPLALDAAWQRVLSLDDSKVSTFLICLGKWMADIGGNEKGLSKTRIHAADILSFRGLKKEKHGGYKRAQKEEARDDILALRSIWVRSVEQVRNERGKLESRAIDSPLLEVTIESNPDLFGGFEPFAFRVAPGDWAEHFLGKHNRYVATLLRPVMRYDPDKQRLAMRLGIYLATQWRNRASTENYDQPWEVGTLLGGAFITQPTTNLDRFRQQFEQALDRLQEDAVIGGWEYVNDSELPLRKWLPIWLGWGVHIVPAGAAIERYSKFPDRRRKAINQGKRASMAAKSRKESA